MRKLKKKIKKVLGLSLLAVFSIASIAIFLCPIYFAFNSGDALQMLAMFVTWIPSFFMFYVGIFIASLIAD